MESTYISYVPSLHKTRHLTKELTGILRASYGYPVPILRSVLARKNAHNMMDSRIEHRFIEYTGSTWEIRVLYTIHLRPMTGLLTSKHPTPADPTRTRKCQHHLKPAVRLFASYSPILKPQNLPYQHNPRIGWGCVRNGAHEMGED